MQLHWEGVLLSEFLPKCFHTVHLSGDGGIPITLLFDFLSKFPWTDLKNILSFCSYMTPLWNGRFILDGHPFVETLASVGNSVYFVHEFCVIIILERKFQIYECVVKLSDETVLYFGKEHKCASTFFRCEDFSDNTVLPCVT